MVKKCIKFDRVGPVFDQTQEIANLDPKFEFGGGAQKLSKNVLNSIVWDQFSIKPRKLQIWIQNSNLEVLPRNGQKMCEIRSFGTSFWSNLGNCKFGPKIRIWSCCPEMVKKCMKFDRLGLVFGQTQEIIHLDPNFEFGGVAQKWSKNVLNSIVLKQFCI